MWHCKIYYEGQPVPKDNLMNPNPDKESFFNYLNKNLEVYFNRAGLLNIPSILDGNINKYFPVYTNLNHADALEQGYDFNLGFHDTNAGYQIHIKETRILIYDYDFYQPLSIRKSWQQIIVQIWQDDVAY